MFFLIFFLSALLLNFISLMDARAEPVKDKAWQQALCPDRTTTFEVCMYGGDGNPCLKGGATTRDCPASTN